MGFTKGELYKEHFSILDIGSYKIRALYGTLSGSGIHIDGYSEKRQEQESVFLGEINDISSVTENIQHVVKKSSNTQQIDTYITNISSHQFFLYSHQLNHVRIDENTPLSDEELYNIIKTLELQAVELGLKDIFQKSGYAKADLKLSLSSISKILIDGRQLSNPLGEKGKNIKLFFVNIFVPLSEYQVTLKMLQSIGISSPQLIPFEYSVSKLFPEEDDVVVINIGNGKTYISIQQGHQIIGTTRLSVGMHDLIKVIKQNLGFTQVEILKNIDEYFENERRDFLEIFEDCIGVGIKEIIKDGICPSKFLIIGGGGENAFIKDFFQQLDLTKHHIKIAHKIEVLPLPKVSLQGAKFLENHSCIDIYSMILAYEYFEKRKNSPLTLFLKKVVEEIENS